VTSALLWEERDGHDVVMVHGSYEPERWWEVEHDREQPSWWKCYDFSGMEETPWFQRNCTLVRTDEIYDLLHGTNDISRVPIRYDESRLSDPSKNILLEREFPRHDAHVIAYLWWRVSLKDTQPTLSEIRSESAAKIAKRRQQLSYRAKIEENEEWRARRRARGHNEIEPKGVISAMLRGQVDRADARRELSWKRTKDAALHRARDREVERLDAEWVEKQDQMDLEEMRQMLREDERANERERQRLRDEAFDARFKASAKRRDWQEKKSESAIALIKRMCSAPIEE